MTKISLDADKFVDLLEQIIDARYKIDKELDYENHKYARDFKKQHYDPLIEEMKKVIVNINKI